MSELKYSNPNSPSKSENFNPTREFFEAISSHATEIKELSDRVKNLSIQKDQVDVLCAAFRMLYFYRMLALICFPALISIVLIIYLFICGVSFQQLLPAVGVLLAVSCIGYMFDVTISGKKIANYDKKFDSIDASIEKLKENGQKHETSFSQLESAVKTLSSLEIKSRRPSSGKPPKK